MARWIGRNWMWALALGTVVVYAPLAGRSSEEKARRRTTETLSEVLGLVQKRTVEPPTPKQVSHAAIQGMLHTLDPHSNYMDETEFRTMREDQRGTFYGIGSIIQQQPDGIVREVRARRVVEREPRTRPPGCIHFRRGVQRVRASTAATALPSSPALGATVRP